MSDLLDVFNLKNLVKEPTCFMSNKRSLIDTILTNKPRSFHKIQGFVTGISYFHELVITVLRSYYNKLPPKNILNRNVKRFEKTTFLWNLDSRLTQGELYSNCQGLYHKLTQICSEVLDYHAPVKQKVVRGNQAPFITKDLSKAIMVKSKTKTQYVKWLSRKNYLAFKKAKNRCNSTNKKAKKDYFKKTAKYGLMTNKEFWEKPKPFPTNEGCSSEGQISMEVNDELVSDE